MSKSIEERGLARRGTGEVRTAGCAEFVQGVLAQVDAPVTSPENGPTIGLRQCRAKNKVVTEYALRDTNESMGVEEDLLVESLSKDLTANLPRNEQIERELGGAGQ